MPPLFYTLLFGFLCAMAVAIEMLAGDSSQQHDKMPGHFKAFRNNYLFVYACQMGETSI